MVKGVIDFTVKSALDIFSGKGLAYRYLVWVLVGSDQVGENGTQLNEFLRVTKSIGL